MNSEEERQLLRNYETAATLYSRAVTEWHQKIGRTSTRKPCLAARQALYVIAKRGSQMAALSGKPTPIDL
jgi:hypothetical protein